MVSVYSWMDGDNDDDGDDGDDGDDDDANARVSQAKKPEERICIYPWHLRKIIARKKRLMRQFLPKPIVKQ